MSLPSVSVVVPCRNERFHIERVVRSIMSTTYPKDRLEVVVVDGDSQDGTRDILVRLVSEFSQLRVISNPRRIIPAALNLGIGASRGEVVVRMDGHTVCPPEYIPACVHGLLETGADNVGGIWLTVPGEPTLLGTVFAHVLSHRFGIGNASYRLGIDRVTEVDAVPFGCMWRKTIEDLGPYDERFARSEDFEYYRRLRAAGGRMLLLPGIVSYYQARSRLGAFLRHSLSNGYWISYPLAFTRPYASLRHYVPALFVAILLLAGLGFGLAWWSVVPFLVVSIPYGVAALTASLDVAVRARRPELLALLPLAFLTLHVAYGFGTLWGILAAGASRFFRRRP